MRLSAALTTALAAVLVAATITEAAAAEQVRDTAMGSQIAEHEGTGIAARSASDDDPTSGIQGIDVASHQGNVDWQDWWNKGKRFAYVKATEGSYYVNPYYGQQYGGSAEVGMKRGAYHFAVPNDSSGTTQANYFVDNGGGWTQDGKTLPGAVDLEWNPYEGGSCYGKTKTGMASWIGDFVSTYRSRTGRYPVIYTSTSWWSLCVDSSAFTAKSPLWIARYNTSVGSLPQDWSSWTLWQYDNSPIDVDKFYGTSTQLKQLVDGPAPSAPTSVTARGGLRRATITWRAPYQPGPGGVTKYRISVSPSGRVIDNIDPAARSQLITGLSTRTTYTFRIRAYNGAGAGAAVAKKLIGTYQPSTLSPTTIYKGSKTTFTGKLRREDTGNGIRYLSVTLQYRKKGSTGAYTDLATTTTRAYGVYSFTRSPWSSTEYRVVYKSGGKTYLGSYTATRTVTVRR